MNEDDLISDIYFKTILKENFIYYRISSQNADIFFQPPLTQDEIANGDKRPEDVEYSLAIYHAYEKNNTYGTGKICHIYRPYWITAKGLKIPAKTYLIDNLIEYIWRIDVPDDIDIKDISNYPLLLDPTFGYTNVGASTASIENRIWVFDATAPSSGDAIKITAYIHKTSTGTHNYKFAIYNSSKNLLEETTEYSTSTAETSWITLNLITKEPLTGSNVYKLCAWGNSASLALEIHYDTGTGASYRDLTYLPNYPNPLGATTNIARNLSIYCTIEINDTDVLDGKLQIVSATTDTNLLDGKLQIASDDTDVLDGKLQIASDYTDVLDGKLQIASDETNELDGKLQVASDETNILDGKLQVASDDTNQLDGKLIIESEVTETNQLDGKLQIASDETNILDGKLQIASDETNQLDGKLQIASYETNQLDGKLQVASDETNQLDGRLQVASDETNQLDGKLIIESEATETNSLDGKLIIASDEINILDGKLQVASDETNILDGKLQVALDETNQLDGKLIIESDELLNLDGKVIISSDENNYLDGKIIIESEFIEILDGKLQITSDITETNVLDGKLIIVSDETNALDAKLTLTSIILSVIMEIANIIKNRLLLIADIKHVGDFAGLLKDITINPFKVLCAFVSYDRGEYRDKIVNRKYYQVDRFYKIYLIHKNIKEKDIETIYLGIDQIEEKLIGYKYENFSFSIISHNIEEINEDHIIYVINLKITTEHDII